MEHPMSDPFHTTGDPTGDPAVTEAPSWTPPTEPVGTEGPAPDGDRPSGWHRVNVGHLVMGMAFLCFVGAWALVQADVVTGDEIRWLLPIPWLVAGAVGLVTVAVSSARRHGVRR
jgi:hypothetical protein